MKSPVDRNSRTWSGAVSSGESGAIRYLLGRGDSFFRRRSRVFLAGSNLFLLVVLGLTDHLIGPEMSFSVFYSLPIFLGTWYGGGMFGIALSIVAAVTWLTADATAGHIYSHSLIPYWNTLVRLLFFLIVSVLLARIRRALALEEKMADSDALTGLANRHSFYEQLENESARSRRYGHPYTIAYIDLDNFKWVNDNLGHEAGDEVLQLTADTIRGVVRETDLVARLGGDEFATLHPETGFKAAGTIFEKIISRLSRAMEKKGVPVTVSMGALTFEKSSEDVREMVKAADDLMYQVKKSGKNNLVHKMWGGVA